MTVFSILVSVTDSRRCPLGKKAALIGLLMLVGGCAHYQIEATNNAVYRLDARTGALEICGFEKGEPKCTPLPAPK